MNFRDPQPFSIDLVVMGGIESLTDLLFTQRAHSKESESVSAFETPMRLRDFCGSQSCIVMHRTATLSVDAS